MEKGKLYRGFAGNIGRFAPFIIGLDRSKVYAGWGVELVAGRGQLLPFSPAEWDPADLFMPGDNGFLDSDLIFSTLYQDSFGFAPVTAVNQPLGLRLDKRLGLVRGAELVANGEFTAGISGWSSATTNTCNISAVGGQLNVTTTASFGRAICQIATVIGRTYEAFVDADPGEGNTAVLQISVLTSGSGAGAPSPAQSTTTAKQLRVVFVANAASTYVAVGSALAALGATLKFDNVSVRELPGNHATQPIAAARPMLRDTPRRVDYDVVDDSMSVVFQSALGSDCTVARSIPGVGAQILTAQTIGTSYTLNVDSCADLVINRALTPDETAKLMALFNARAGV